MSSYITVSGILPVDMIAQSDNLAVMLDISVQVFSSTKVNKSIDHTQSQLRSNNPKCLSIHSKILIDKITTHKLDENFIIYSKK